MDNENEDYVYESTTRHRGRKQPKASQVFSTQRDNPTHVAGHKLAHKQNML